MNESKAEGGRDTEVDSHIALFIERLPQTIGLERVMNLSLENPQATLAVLLEVRAAIEAEKKKAQALYTLKRTPMYAAAPSHSPTVPAAISPAPGALLN